MKKAGENLRIFPIRLSETMNMTCRAVKGTGIIGGKKREREVKDGIVLTWENGI